MRNRIRNLLSSAVIDASKLSLQDFLELIDHELEGRMITCCFPSDRLREEYVESIDGRSEKEIRKLLLRFLIPTGTLGADEHLGRMLISKQRQSETEFERRLLLHELKVKGKYPWEGITWVVDLCGYRPAEAIAALHAYSLAHIQYLPDGRYHGIHDSLAIIRAKFIGTPKTNSEKVATLAALTPRHFELIVERLYDAMGYETLLTPPQNDGGRDVMAYKETPGRRETLCVECKRHGNSVSVETARSLLGVVSDQKATKGVLVSTSSFTRGARDFARRNPNLELISGSDLVCLMNEHLGTRWPTSIDWLIAESEPTSSTPRTD